MKDLSFFLFNNSLGAKMKKGFRNSCNGNASTSTLDQHLPDSSNCLLTPSSLPSQPSPTLEDMILQLKLEEELAENSRLCEYGVRGRMSCVNNSDILRSARNALNQYPRFSLDGKDAMYRSSFRNLNAVEKGRKSVCCDRGLSKRIFYGSNGDKSEKCNLFLPATVAGESVVWCKPGVVAKLMGLEAMPVPANSKEGKELSCIIRRQNLRRKAERREMERRSAMNHRARAAAGYRVLKPENPAGGWSTGRFL